MFLFGKAKNNIEKSLQYSKNVITFAASILAESTKWSARLTDIYNKALLRFVLTSKNLANSTISHYKATVMPAGYVYCTSHDVCIYMIVGFRRCSFLTDGQCESLGAWDGQQHNPTFFILYGS